MKTKKEMIEHIAGMASYPTMNSWNLSRGYAYNVKIHKLPLTEKQRNALYEAMDTQEFFDDLALVLEEANENEMVKHGTYTHKKQISINIEGMSAEAIATRRKAWEASGYIYDRHGTTTMCMWKNEQKPIFEAGFNGRSGGYLVLYKWNGHNMAGTGWTHEREELEEMTRGEVKSIYDVLVSFKKVHDTLLDHVRYVADHSRVTEEEYTETKTRKVLTVS